MDGLGDNDLLSHFRISFGQNETFLRFESVQLPGDIPRLSPNYLVSSVICLYERTHCFGGGFSRAIYWGLSCIPPDIPPSLHTLYMSAAFLSGRFSYPVSSLVDNICSHPQGSS